MLYLLAAVGVVTVAVLLWRAFTPHRVEVGARSRLVAPDDDPDFLRRLDEQNRGPDEGRPGDNG
ncbi:MAG TPA: hypothetical protein VHW44_31140 [Pseudonocardiaceae bacterium]|jgi:hypothetical protein|nr:hypothetical protein [Pseudonocardiaceae bacterium]